MLGIVLTKGVSERWCMVSNRWWPDPMVRLGGLRRGGYDVDEEKAVKAQV